MEYSPNPSVDAVQQHHLIVVARSGEPDAELAKVQLLTAHIPLMKGYIRAFLSSRDNLLPGERMALASDALQEAHEAFLIALQRYKVGSNTTIGSYASKYIKGRVGRTIRKEQQAAHVKVDLDDPVVLNEVTDEELLDRNLDRNERQAAVRRFVASLTSTQQEVYRLMYVEQLSQAQVAIQLGISPSSVSQTHQVIMRRGRQELEEYAPVYKVA